jgi:hypothetical protein
LRKPRVKYPLPPFTRIRFELCHTDNTKPNNPVRVLCSMAISFPNSEYKYREVVQLVADAFEIEEPLPTEVLLHRAEEKYKKHLERFDQSILERINRFLAQQKIMDPSKVVPDDISQRLVELPSFHPRGIGTSSNRRRKNRKAKSRGKRTKAVQVHTGETRDAVRKASPSVEVAQEGGT